MESIVPQNFSNVLKASTLQWTVSTTSSPTNATAVTTQNILSQQGLSTASVTFLMVLCCLAILENIFTCYLIYANAILHTATNIFVFSLCITDMLCAGVLLPIAVFRKESYAYLYLAAITVFTYAANLTAVTYERLISITKPLQYRSIVTKKIALRITIAAWILPLSYCLLPIAWKTNTSGLEHKIYIIVALLVFLVFPLFFICFVYIRILFEIHRLLKGSKHLLVYAVEENTDEASHGIIKRLRKSISCNLRQNKRDKQEKANKGNRSNEDSNEETSFTCKSEIYASTLFHEFPNTVGIQSRCQKQAVNSDCEHIHLNAINAGHSSSNIIGVKDSINKSVDNDEGVVNFNDEILCNSEYTSGTPQTKNFDLELRLIVQENSQDPEKDSEEQPKCIDDVMNKNLDNAQDALDDELRCHNTVWDAEAIYNEEATAEQKFIEEEGEKLPPEGKDQSSNTSCQKGLKRNQQAKSGIRRKRSMRRRQILDEIKASAAFAAVAFTYMFTWIPVIYMTFMEAIERLDLVPRSVDDVNIWSIALNAAIDPLFYALILRNFRKVIKKKYRKMKNRYK